VRAHGHVRLPMHAHVRAHVRGYVQSLMRYPINERGHMREGRCAGICTCLCVCMCAWTSLQPWACAFNHAHTQAVVRKDIRYPVNERRQSGSRVRFYIYACVYAWASHTPLACVRLRSSNACVHASMRMRPPMPARLRASNACTSARCTHGTFSHLVSAMGRVRIGIEENLSKLSLKLI
jgi:hypothetical protein